MRMLGKFEIIEEVGRGGFARVYRARDPGLDREVALKVLAPHLTWDPTFAERFRHEAQATAKLDHPNIVAIYEVGQDGEDLYIAMKYLEGQTLAALLAEQGALDLERALPILEQVASALDYAHGEGVLHRDIKPSNVMVQAGKDGEVRATLTDFGLVKAMEGSQSLTSKGTILGSPHYMAPEQADIKRTHEIGAATDLYSLGVVAYEMLVGELPFPGDTTSTLMARLQYDPPDPQSIRDDLPEDVAQVLLKALSRDGKDRYPSAGAMVEVLGESVEAREKARQREEQLVHLYQLIGASVEAEDWRTAEARCREILALDPEYRDVPELWMRVRSERARQRELEQLYQAAQAASERRSWPEVKDLCLEIQALAPAYRDVGELLAWAEKEQAAEQAVEERRARLATLYREAQAAVQDRRWRAAVGLYEEIEASEPGYRDVRQRLQEAQVGLREAQAQEKKQSQLAELYAKAQAASRSQLWGAVRRLCGEIGALEPGYRDTEGLLARAEKELAEEKARRRHEAALAEARGGEHVAAAGKEELAAPVEEAPAMEPAPGAPEPVGAKKRRGGLSRRAWLVGSLVVVALVIIVVVAWQVNEAAQDRARATRIALAMESEAARVARLTSTAEAQASATGSAAGTATAQAAAAATAEAVRATSSAEAAAATGSVAGTATVEAAATAVAEAVRSTSTTQAGATATARAAATVVSEAVRLTSTARAKSTATAGAVNKAGFQDSFDGNALSWDEGDYEDELLTGNQRITAGVYRWKVTETSGAYWRSVPRGPDTSWGDLHLTVEAERTEGTGGYGLVFRYVDEDNYYSWLVYDSSQWSKVVARVDDEWVWLGEFESSAIRPGKTNQLTVVGIGSHFLFFVNDQFLGELDDDTHAQGKVGIDVNVSEGDTGVFEFDNFEMDAWRAQIQETFDDSALSWYEGDIEGDRVTGNRRITGGVYRWQITESSGAFWRSLPEAIDSSWSDLHLTLEARRTEGAGGYGLVFRHVDWDNYYTWLVNESTQKSSVYARVDDEWVSLGAFDLSAIRPGVTNRLTVVGTGSHFAFFVNDQFVSELDDATHDRGSVGVAVDMSDGDTGVFEFDNFEVYIP